MYEQYSFYIEYHGHFYDIFPSLQFFNDWFKLLWKYVHIEVAYKLTLKSPLSACSCFIIIAQPPFSYQTPQLQQEMNWMVSYTDP